MILASGLAGAQAPSDEARGARDALPEIVVLHGEAEMIPWLELENWWGPEDENKALSVPHVMITAIHPSWKEYSQNLTVPVKKELFYRLMLPLVMHANLMVSEFRKQIQIAEQEYAADGRVSDESLAMIRRAAFALPGREDDGAEDILADDPRMAEIIDALLYRIDIVPNGLALGQAAYESGYGTSRFATEGNSLFGQWTYKGEGLKPREQRTQSKGDHRIRAFEWPFDSVRAYFINLMTHRAYEDFRRLRAELRAEGKPLDSLVLADGLTSYSERGQDYVDSLKGIIRVNKLDRTDDAVFRDEPMRFLLSEQSLADVAAMNERLDEAALSGELAEIIERMRLE
ncbi:MAG: glucosaminidase domain-containing protein [Pseudomonadota bacterium]